jgi:hypothetical protein
MNLKATKKLNNVRKFTGGGPRPDLRKLRQKEAKERLTVWQKLSPREQLASLDGRLGKGVGAQKQRARIAVALAESKPLTGIGKRTAPAEQVKQKAKERRAQEKAERPSK